MAAGRGEAGAAHLDRRVGLCGSGQRGGNAGLGGGIAGSAESADGRESEVTARAQSELRADRHQAPALESEAATGRCGPSFAAATCVLVAAKGRAFGRSASGRVATRLTVGWTFADAGDAGAGLDERLCPGRRPNEGARFSPSHLGQGSPPTGGGQPPSALDRWRVGE